MNSNQHKKDSLKRLIDHPNTPPNEREAAIIALQRILVGERQRVPKGSALKKAMKRISI